MIIRLIVFIIELPVIFLTELIQELYNSKVIQKFGRVVNDITASCLCTILLNEHVQECIAIIIAEGMNTFIQQDDLDVHIKCMANTLSKTQPELARKQGEDFPIVVGSFLQGMIQGKQQQQQQQQIQNNNNDNIQNDSSSNKIRTKNVSLSPKTDSTVNSICSLSPSYQQLKNNNATDDDDDDDDKKLNNDKENNNNNNNNNQSDKKQTTTNNNNNNTFDIPKLLNFPSFRLMTQEAKDTNNKQQDNTSQPPQHMDSDTLSSTDPVEIAASILAETASLVTDNETIIPTTTDAIIME